MAISTSNNLEPEREKGARRSKSAILLKVVNYALLAVQLLILAYVVKDTLWVIRLKGGARAQDVMVLCPLFYAYRVSIVHAVFLTVVGLSGWGQRAAVGRLFFVLAAVSILLPLAATPILRYVIDEVYW